MTPRLLGQCCKLVRISLSHNPQKELTLKESNTKYRGLEAFRLLAFPISQLSLSSHVKTGGEMHSLDGLGGKEGTAHRVQEALDFCYKSEMSNMLIPLIFQVAREGI